MRQDLWTRSIEIIRAGQAPTGAYIASPNFPTYRYSWLRDGAFIAYGMDRAGAHDSAHAFHRWVGRTIMAHAEKVTRLEAKLAAGEQIEPGDWLHCRYTLDGQEGDEDWGHFQLDGYGTWLWSLVEHARLADASTLVAELAAPIAVTVRYLTRFWRWPNWDCWEEHPEHVHPSTLACLWGGLQAIRPWLRDTALVTAIDQTCPAIKAYVQEHFVHDGRLTKWTDGTSTDANLLWAAVPFGLFPPGSPVMDRTVATLTERCLTGGLHRYPEDTYYGGGEWLLLTAWLGWYWVQAGAPDRAVPLLEWVEAQADSAGALPEQVSERLNDPTMLQPWLEKWGPVANPLLWSHAMYLVLLAEMVG